MQNGSGMAELTASIDLPLGLDAPRVARQALRTILTGWGLHDRDWLDTAEVIVSELVSNAVRHGGGCLAFMADMHDQQVTVSAADGSEVLPERRDPTTDGGRGLMLIELLCARWGVDHNYQGGKRVWAVLTPHPETQAS